jgi:integrase/recombinase XerD
MRRLAKVLADAEHLRFYGENRHSWQTVVVDWAQDVAQTIKPSTLRRYLTSLRQLDGILSELYVDQITAATIGRIARRAGVSNATRRRDISAVSMVLRWCSAQGYREDNPARVWDRGVIKERRDPIRLPEDYDIDCVVAAAPGNFARMILFARYTGMRQEEVASLERHQVDLRREAATLTRTKTNRPRSVPLDERALGTYAGTPPRLGSPFVFWHGSGSRYLNVATRFAKITRNAQARARAAKQPVPQRFRFHDLHHWFAVDYLRRGGGIYQLQKILGHSTIRTTEIYLDFLTPEEQEASKARAAQ